MSLYNKASLIQVPSLYKDGLLVSTVPEDRSGDFTFTRGSNLSATRVNEQGYIEKGYENLLLQSNSFDTTWATSGTLTPNQTGYNGSTDAWLYEKSAAFQQIGQTISQGGVSTFSVYLKAGSYEWVRLRISNLENAYYQLTGDGSLGTIAGGAISAKIDSVGNGWYRCSISVNSTISDVKIYPVLGDNDMGTSGSIYIQDALLNQGLVAYPYIETTTAPVAGGILEDEPRIDFSDGCGHLLLEPSRTNLVPHSEYLDGMVQDNSDITNNSILSPEGILNASKIEGQGGALYIRARRVLTLPAAGNYCFSIFAKAGTSSNFTIIIANYTATGNTSADFVLTGSGSTTSNDATIEPVGDGWYRCCVYPIMDGVDLTGNFYVYVGDDTGSIFFPSHGDTLGQNLYLYGMQVEQDATYPTSYIPTYGVSQTRLEDEAPFPATFRFGTLGDGESGTMVVKTIVNGLTDNNRFNFFSNGGSANWYWNGFNLYSQTSGGSRQFNLGSTASSNLGTEVKLCMRKSGNTLSCFFNGDEKGSIDIGSESIRYFNDFSTYFVSQSVVEFIEFPTALTDSECIALTTIT